MGFAVPYTDIWPHNCRIALVPVKQGHDFINLTKQSAAKICVYIMQCTAYCGDTLIHPMVTRINLSPPGQNGRHFANDFFKCIFFNEKFCTLIANTLKFIPKGPIDNKSALLRVMAWRRSGDKPLLEALLTQFTDAYMRH